MRPPSRRRPTAHIQSYEEIGSSSLYFYFKQQEDRRRSRSAQCRMYTSLCVANGREYFLQPLFRRRQHRSYPTPLLPFNKNRWFMFSSPLHRLTVCLDTLPLFFSLSLLDSERINVRNEKEFSPSSSSLRHHIRGQIRSILLCLSHSLSSSSLYSLFPAQTN